MIRNFNGIELKNRDFRVMDVVMSHAENGSTATTSDIQTNVADIDYNKQAHRCFDRLEDAGLVELNRNNDSDLPDELPSPKTIEPTKLATGFADEVRLSSDEYQATTDIVELANQIDELDDRITRIEETVQQLTGRSGVIKRELTKLEEEVNQLTD
jgi:peptidoglycan hydrolase CwlO-like protein